MADGTATATQDPHVEMRTIFREETQPLRTEVGDVKRSLEEKTGTLQTRLDQLETELRAVPSLQVREREAPGTLQDKILGRAFFNRELDEIRTMGKGQVTPGGDIVQRAFSQGLIAGSGTLNAEQSDMFLSLTQDQAGFLQLLQFETMNGPTKEVGKLSVASRIMRPKTGGQRGNNADAALGTPLILTSKEGAISTQIYFETLEDNIMRGRATNYLQEEFALVFANDLADLAVNGDESLPATITDTNSDGLDDANGDSQADRVFRRQNDGFLRLFRADNTVHDVSGAGMAGDVKGRLFPALRDALPQKFRRLKPALLVSHKIKDTYLDQLENRVSELGDMVLKNGWEVPTWQGYPVVGVDHYPDGAATFTPFSNLVYGVQRGITFGVDIYNVERVAVYGWSVRVDYGVKHGATTTHCEDFAFI